jgi:hypothetical protein
MLTAANRERSMDCRIKPSNDEWSGAIQFNRNMLSREKMAISDPSLVVAKADIRQQAINGGEVPAEVRVPSFMT